MKSQPNCAGVPQPKVKVDCLGTRAFNHKGAIQLRFDRFDVSKYIVSRCRLPSAGEGKECGGG